jgi:hypothetical protein
VCRNVHEHGCGPRGAAHARGGCGRIHGGSTRCGGRRDRARRAHCGCDAEADADAYRDTHVLHSQTRDAVIDALIHAGAQAKDNPHPDDDPDPDPDPDSDAHPRGGTETHQETDVNPHADPCRQAHGEADSVS